MTTTTYPSRTGINAGGTSTASGAAASWLLNPSSSFSNGVAPSSLTSLGGPNYARFRAKKAAVAAKVPGARARVLYVGSSISSGFYANGFGNTTNANMAGQAVPKLMASYLNAAGLPASASSFMGDQNALNANYGTYDTRITGGATYTLNPGTLGGLIGSLTAGSLSFLPLEFVDSCRFWYPNISGRATFSGSRTGDTGTGTVTPGATTAFLHADMLSGIRSNALPFTFTFGSGSNALLAGMECWDSTVPAISLINGAAGSYQSSDFINSTAPYSYLPAIVAFAPDLVILEAPINDWILGVAQATSFSNLQTFLSTVLPVADVIIETSNPCLNSGTPLLTQVPYVNDPNYGLLHLASINNAPGGSGGLAVNDVFNRFQSAELQTNLGIVAASTTLAAAPYARMANGVHPTRNVYLERAQVMANMILAI